MPREKKALSITVRLDPSMAELLDQLEDATGKSRSEVLRQGLLAIIRTFMRDGVVEFPLEVATPGAINRRVEELVEERLKAADPDKLEEIYARVETSVQARADEIMDERLKKFHPIIDAAEAAAKEVLKRHGKPIPGEES